MVQDDRDEATDETVRQEPALPAEQAAPADADLAETSLAETGLADTGHADTMMAPVTPATPKVPITPLSPLPPMSPMTVPPLPPAPSLGGTLPPTRRIGRPGDDPAAGAGGPSLGAGDASRYTVGTLLGQGGMGEVLLATDEHIGREVAIKRIRAADPTNEELSRFVREARVQGRLEHPAVVPVHDLGIDREGRPYFVMKRLAGTDMSELLKRLRDGKEPDEAGRRRLLLRAFAEVCLAVEFAHSRNIIHRDLKPANIMLGDFGEVYVLDWGVARTSAEAEEGAAPPSGSYDLRLDTGDTRVGTVLGTPPYMAPEQLAGDRAGPAADIYALGCILYEIAAGVPLHPRARSVGQAFQPVDARPSLMRPESPPELDAICVRATQVESAARYESARALGDAVQAYLDGDRDVAARVALARQHLAEARAALARGDDEQHRRDAMRAAGRALALDPTATEAADLVTHLMLTPPRAVPAEVDRHLAAHDTEAASSQGRLAAVAMMGYLAFVPLFLWTGVREALPLIIYAALAVLSGLQVYVLSRLPRISPVGIYTNVCINALLIALICRMVGPFIIAPTLATTTLVPYAVHAKLGRISIVASILAASVAVPWALEALGVLSSTYRFEGGELVLSSGLVRFSAAPVQLAFAVLLVTLIAVVAVLSRGIAARQREATRQLELQAWHLRQILPGAAR
jgi:serine/threonine-protein kinase